VKEVGDLGSRNFLEKFRREPLTFNEAIESVRSFHERHREPKPRRRAHRPKPQALELQQPHDRRERLTFEEATESVKSFHRMHRGGKPRVRRARATREEMVRKLPQMVAAILSRTYIEMGDSATLADDEALEAIQKLVSNILGEGRRN
jgi:hypothetical protein